MYSPLSAFFDDVIPQQPALSNDGKQRQPALGDFTSPNECANGLLYEMLVIKYLPKERHRKITPPYENVKLDSETSTQIVY
jgi:hypothetical protein